MFRFTATFGVVTALTLGVVSNVRADLLDVEINRLSPKIVSELKKKYKNVGVLRFRVQDVGRKETFSSPMAGRMAERFETALILHADQGSSLLGVTRNPGLTASRAGIANWYRSATDRKKLFTLNYPLAWGREKVKIDAFLTGKVELSKDRSKTIVKLQYFDRTKPETLVQLARFEKTTSTTILRDVGFPFVLSRNAKQQVFASKRDARQTSSKYAIRMVNQNFPPDQGDIDETVPPQQMVSLTNVQGIELQTLVNGTKVAPRSTQSADSMNAFELISPAEGSEIAFRLINTTDKWLGVSLRLNGMNTLGEGTSEPLTSPKWLIPPKKSYLIKGFYDLETQQNSLPKYKPFKVLVGQEAESYRSQQMGDRVGLIELDVFEGGPGDVADEADLFISMRGLPPSALKRERTTYAGLKRALLRNAKLKTRTANVKQGSLVVKRELIVPDVEAIDADGITLKIKELPNPIHLGGVSIRVMPGGIPAIDEQ